MAFLGMRPGEVWGGGWEHPPGPIMMRGAAALGSALLGMPFLSSVLCMGSVGDCWDPPLSNIGVSAAAEGGGQGGDKVMGTRGFGLWQYLTAPNELQQLPLRKEWPQPLFQLHPDWGGTTTPLASRRVKPL